ncbi:MAG: hypothetical protein ACR2RA_22060 [Geminicoccaceae bacterium]
MVAFNKFDDTVEQLLTGTHDFNAAGDQMDVYLSNATPSASLDAVKADLAEIATGNGYTGPEDMQNDMSETGGTATVTGVDVVITASGGAIATFRYVVWDNDTPTSPADPLLGWWDNGSTVDLADGESFTVDFGASVATLA